MRTLGMGLGMGRRAASGGGGPPVGAIAITSHSSGQQFFAGATYTISGTRNAATTPVTVRWNGVSIGTATLGVGTWSLSWTPTVAQASASTLVLDAIGTVSGGVDVSASINATVWAPTLITSVVKDFWLRSDLGITLATGVSAWADQFGLNNASQGTAGFQPLVTASAIDGRPALAFDGTDDFMVFPTLNLPGTTPVFLWAIMRVPTWGLGRAYFGSRQAAGTQSISVVSTGVTPQLGQFNGATVNVNAGAVVNTWVRAGFLFDNTTGSFVRLGSTQVTGGNPGNRDPAAGQFAVGALDNGVGPARVDYAEIMCFRGVPTELATLNAYGAARYPSASF